MAQDEDEDIDYADDEENENSGFFRWLQAVIVMSALGGFFGLAWYAYKSGDTADDKDVELVKVEKGPVKEAPTNPGGMQIPNQDKTVYNLINGGKTDKPVVERIMPPTEEPVQRDADTQVWTSGKLKGAPPGAQDKPKLAAQAENVSGQQDTAQAGKAQPFNPEKARAAPSTAVTPVLAQDTPSLMPSKAGDDKASAPEVKPASAAPADTTKPVAPEPAAAKQQATPAQEEEAENAPAPVPQKPVPEKKAASSAKLPKIRIQLGALKSESEAENEWKKIARGYTNDVGGKQHFIVKATVNGKTYYRLQAGPFDSAKQAENACMGLVSDGRACFVAK